MRKFLDIIFLILALAACQPPFPDSGKAVFRYNEASNITSLDPAFAKDQAHIWPCHQLFNGLLQLDENLEIKPCIAKSWHTDSAGLVYFFHLRDDVFFHDDEIFPGGTGRRVVAGDFVFSFNRLVDTALASPGAWVFSKVLKENGRYAFKALNDTLLSITLQEPFPPFPGILTMIYCSVVPPEIDLIADLDFRKHPIGTGPFRFKTWKEGVKLVMVKNEKYFEYSGTQRLPFLDAVSITFVADRQLAFLEFVKGNLDFISGLDQSYKDELLSRDGRLRPKYAGRFLLITQPFLNTEYLGILVDTSLEIVRNSPLRHPEIRKAINCGFDRRKMIRYLRNNTGYPGLYSILPPGFHAFDTTVAGYDYEPEKALELIRQAGYESPADVPEITLHTTAEYVDLFKYIQHQLGELGMKMKIEVNPAATLMEMKARSKVNFFRASWIADYPDEENYLSLFYSKNKAPAGPNYSRYANPEYDRLFELSQKTENASERISLYMQMNEMIIEESPVIVLYYDQVVRFTQQNVEGLGSNPLNLLSLKNVIKH